MLRYHTLNYLTEKIYTINDCLDEEDIHYELSTFFSKLMNRRREEQIDLGLQAGGVIYPDKAGFKIAERDGKASHAQTQENVSQYLNGETAFSSEEDVGMINSRKNDPNSWANISKNGFTVRIVANRNGLVFIFNSQIFEPTSFQMDAIYEIFGYIKKVYDEGIIRKPYINFLTAKDKFVYREFMDSDEQLLNLEKLLTDKIEAIKKRTR